MIPAELSPASREFLDGLARDLRSDPIVSAPMAGVDPQVEPYLLAAAVLHVFTITTLRPSSSDAPKIAPAPILAASDRAPGFLTERGRSLTPNKRAEALAIIRTTKKALEIIERNPARIMTDVQRFFEELLSGRKPDLSSLSHAELVAVRQANQWAKQLSAEGFDEHDLLIAIESSAAMASFQHLIPERFIGRDELLLTLREFAGIVERGLARRFRALVFGDRRLLVLEGVGGIGKTAALGQFLHRYRADEFGPLLPFAYLACDDRDIDPKKPETMLAEAARQFGRLVHIRRSMTTETESAVRFEALLERFMSRAAGGGELEQELTSRRSAHRSQEGRVQVKRDFIWALAEDFAALAVAACEALARSGSNPPSALLIIDTFEEVEYQAREQLLPLWTTLEHIFAAAPPIKVIISGRGPISTIPIEVGQQKITLLELDEDASVELLVRETGLPRNDLAPVVHQVGGSPLNLRLAARIISDGDSPKRGGTEGLTTRRFGILRVGPELIAGQLYRRLLERIHDDDIKALADPGMVLRRVTPDIIRRVLSPACGLKVVKDEHAQELFAKLMNEHTLVKLEDDRSLRYRDDIRIPVVKLITLDKPQLTRRVHEKAIEYYRGRSDPVSIAEHVYHRLVLGGDTKDLEDRWVAEAERYLRTAIPELPPEGRVWLASRMSIELPEKLRRQADAAGWENIVGPRALAVLESRSSEDALVLLRQRRERTPESPLFAIEARLLVSTGDLRGAESLLRDALTHFPPLGNPGRRAELLWLASQVARRVGKLDEANERLDELVAFAPSVRGGVALVQALASRLLHSDPKSQASRHLQQALVDALGGLTEEETYRGADIVRTAYARLPVDVAPAARRVLVRIGSSLTDMILRMKDDIDLTPLPALYEAGKRAREVPALARLAGTVSDTFKDGQARESDLLKLLDGALAALATEDELSQSRKVSSPEDQLSLPKDVMSAEKQSLLVAGVFAAEIVWYLLQLERGDLGASTLAGLDEYRAGWELAASSFASA